MGSLEQDLSAYPCTTASFYAKTKYDENKREFGKLKRTRKKFPNGSSAMLLVEGRKVLLVSGI